MAVARADARGLVRRERVVAAVGAGERALAEESGRGARARQLFERVGPATVLRAEEQGGVADHAQVVVADEAAALCELQLGADQAADEGVGEVDEAVLALVAARHERAHVCELRRVAEAAHRPAVLRLPLYRRDDAAEGGQGVAAQVQARLGVCGDDAHVALGVLDLSVVNAEVLSRRAARVRVGALGVGEEGVHLGVEEFGLLEAEEERHVAALADEGVAARYGHVLDDEVVEGAQALVGLDGELVLEAVADARGVGLAVSLVEEVRAPEVAGVEGVEEFGQAAELDEVEVFGHVARERRDFGAAAGEHLLPGVTLDRGAGEA